MKQKIDLFHFEKKIDRKKKRFTKQSSEEKQLKTEKLSH